MSDKPSGTPDRPLVVRGTEIIAADTRQRYREKIARITLDSMVQFVGLLDAQGTVLEINKVALDAVGIKLSDVEGKPFWTTFWWQVSDEINQGIRDSIARAAKGEFVRWDTRDLRARRRQGDDHHRRLAHAGDGRRRQRSCSSPPRGATSPRRRRRSARSRRRTSSCRGCSSASASSTRSRRSSSPTSATSCGRRSPSSSARRSG